MKTIITLLTVTALILFTACEHRPDLLLDEGLGGPLDGAWSAHYTGYGGYNPQLHFVSPATGWLTGEIEVYIDPADLDPEADFVMSAGSVGNLAVLKTSDGGRTWSEITLPHDFYYNENTGLFFLDSATGWLTSRSDGQAMARTTDGVTWEKIIPDLESINAFHFISATTGWALRENEIHRTDDGGETWVLQFTHSHRPPNVNASYFGKKLWFTGPGDGWVLAVDHYFEVGATAPHNTELVMLRTTDGTSWDSVWAHEGLPDGSDEVMTPRYFKMFADGSGWILYTYQDEAAGYKEYSKVLRTADYGVTWNEVTVPENNVRSMVFADGNRGWISGMTFAEKEFVYRTVDGGLTWEKQGAPLLDVPSFIAAVDSNHAWIACGTAVVLRTVTGGQ